MYCPSYWMRVNGVPILSRQQIDHIGEKIVYDFCPEAMRTPQAIDIDLLVEEYLKMQVDYQYLSNNGIYLGMTVFFDSDRVPIYDEKIGEADYIFVKGNTVLIDRGLLEESQIRRYRFTMGHEAAHSLLHRTYFSKLVEEQIAARENVSLLPCRVSEEPQNKQQNEEWSDRDWLEWQADTLSSAILMPKSMVWEAVGDLIEREPFPAPYIHRVMDVFQVSQAAAFYRLKQLQLYPKDIWRYPSVVETWHIGRTAAVNHYQKEDDQPFWRELIEAEDILPF